jgi:hypothetical protein
MKNQLNTKLLVYEYEQKIKHLEQRILDLENELFKKECQIKITSKVTVKSVPSKKQEIINAIEYLKNKKVKTKQDKDSIYSLEMVLKNMK